MRLDVAEEEEENFDGGGAEAKVVDENVIELVR